MINPASSCHPDTVISAEYDFLIKCRVSHKPAGQILVLLNNRTTSGQDSGYSLIIMENRNQKIYFVSAYANNQKK